MASANTVDLQRLGRSAATAHCPACGTIGTTRVWVEWQPEERIATQLICSAMTMCLVLPCLLRTTDHSTHVCSTCGLRLAITTGTLAQRTHVQPATGFGAVSAPIGISPLGPKMAADLAAAPHPYKTRYEALAPVRILHIEPDGPHGLPGTVREARTVPPLFLIESPGVPPVNDSRDGNFFDSYCAWSTQSVWDPAWPHFRVSALAGGRPRELVRLQLYGAGSPRGRPWDAAMSAPLGGGPGMPPQFVGWMITAPRPGEWTWLGDYDAPQFLWWSSEGRLLWLRRLVRDGTGVQGRLLCLFDAYDRLLAIMRCTERQGKTFAELALYADFSELLVAEILASYVAFVVQRRRVFEINDTNS